VVAGEIVHVDQTESKNRSVTGRGAAGTVAVGAFPKKVTDVMG
jgi:hypothetical protein